MRRTADKTRIVALRAATTRAVKIRIPMTSIATINGKSIQDLTTTIGKSHETCTTSIVTTGREASGTAIDCLRNTNRGSAKATCSIGTCAERFTRFLRTITDVYLLLHAAIVTSSSAGMLV